MVYMEGRLPQAHDTNAENYCGAGPDDDPFHTSSVTSFSVICSVLSLLLPSLTNPLGSKAVGVFSRMWIMLFPALFSLLCPLD